jgi:hypothetical protein
MSGSNALSFMPADAIPALWGIDPLTVEEQRAIVERLERPREQRQAKAKVRAPSIVVPRESKGDRIKRIAREVADAVKANDGSISMKQLCVDVGRDHRSPMLHEGIHVLIRAGTHQWGPFKNGQHSCYRRLCEVPRE